VTRQDDELHAIDRFLELIESVARSPQQRERVLDAAGVPLSGAGLNALRLIARHGPLPVTEVARRLGVDQSTASRQIKPLEDGGLLDRTADDADRRVAWLAVTEDGRGVLARVHDLRRHDLALVLADWSARERSELARLLDRFRHDLIDAPAAGRAAG
jgi:DNA-binding MarR family transcriptional regulator